MTRREAAIGGFAMLDGLRGIAAVMILLLLAVTLSPIRVAGGYLAVDFFFL